MEKRMSTRQRALDAAAAATARESERSESTDGAEPRVAPAPTETDASLHALIDSSTVALRTIDAASVPDRFAGQPPAPRMAAVRRTIGSLRIRAKTPRN
jgi:hypothetical protein